MENYIQRAEVSFQEKTKTGLESSTSIPTKGHAITIEDVRVEFPVKPYDAQIQLMTKIIHSLNKGENSLLESPTGSGKSLALLCGTLAWIEQQKYKALQRVKIDSENLLESSENQTKSEKDSKKKSPISNDTTIIVGEDMDTIEIKSEFDLSTVHINSNHSAHRSVTTKVEIENGAHGNFQKRAFKRFTGEPIRHNPKTQLEGVDSNESSLDSKEKSKIRSVPRVFIGSRTHKQLSQLISELRYKTKYKPRTSVLASREHLCIHKDLRDSSNKTDDCLKLQDKGSCTYRSKSNKVVSHSAIVDGGIWDIEDIVKIGKEVHGCPYYASKDLFHNAEVIFSPYNYIIDPVIREVMGINLSRDIIVLDEAHNIEDAARSGGSIELSENTMVSILDELSFVISFSRVGPPHRILEAMITRFRELVTSQDIVYTNKDYDRYARNFTGTMLLNKLEEANINRDTYKNYFLPAFKEAVEHAEKVRREREDKSIKKSRQQTSDDTDIETQPNIMENQCLSNGSLTVFKGIFLVLGILFDSSHKYANDYELVFIKAINRESDEQFSKRRKTSAQYVSQGEWTYKLAFWCLDPSIIFRKMSDPAYSVILTSGTLSPLNTFASELNTAFPERLEANHVINSSQVWVNAIPFGKSHIALKGVYGNINSSHYQDEIGEALCRIVEAVPYGILVFMPSYKAIDTMMNRWELTGVLERISSKKLVLTEPKGKDKRLFEKTLKKYYNAIRSIEEGDNVPCRDGALMLAVFRGKASEGIDFSDNFCRAVVTLGIPYPGIKDLEVILKKDYNNRTQIRDPNRKVLSGSDWYSAQAYRAINQALGRCIRHKNDWGAIILLEERFSKLENVKGLSKWVQKLFKVEPTYEASMASLKLFVERQLTYTQKVNLKQLSEKNFKESHIKLEDNPMDFSIPSLDFEPQSDSIAPISVRAEPFFEDIVFDVIKTEPITQNINDPYGFESDWVDNDVENMKASESFNPSTGFVNNPENKSTINRELVANTQNVACYACRKCSSALLEGPESFIQPIGNFNLTRMADCAHMIELANPQVWMSSSKFIGGTLDIKQLPASNNVIYDVIDEMCYRKFSCSCDKEVTIGVLICAATSQKRMGHVGKFYLFGDNVRLTWKDELVLQGPSKVDTPSDFDDISDDCFFNL